VEGRPGRFRVLPNRVAALSGLACASTGGVPRHGRGRFDAARESERQWARIGCGHAAVTFDDLLAYCLAKPGAWQDEPWEGDVVAKVDKRIFAFVAERSVGIKCGDDRDEADEWLARYPEDASVMAYIGRSGWNTLRLNQAIPDRKVLEAVDDSYLTVVSKLPRRRRPDGWDG